MRPRDSLETRLQCGSKVRPRYRTAKKTELGREIVKDLEGKIYME